MKVSFVIPLYNCLPLTQDCLASLHATVPPELIREIVLVDDGSTDGTREWLRTLGPPYRVLLNERNLGYAASNNRGVGAATGEIVALLNNDLVLLPDWLPPLLRPLRRWRVGLVGNLQLEAATGALHHAGIEIDGKVKPAHRTVLPPLARWRRYARVPAVTGACLFARRATYLSLGGFDEAFRNGGEDVDLCFRARAHRLEVWLALRSVVRHHVSASPGRKLHDEANSYLLARRWGPELIAEAARPFCRDYLRMHWHEPRNYDLRIVWQALLFLARLRRAPPLETMIHPARAYAQELRHWRETFGEPHPPEA